jgi:hypothetical protein
MFKFNDHSHLIEMLVTATEEEKEWYRYEGQCHKILANDKYEQPTPYKALLIKLCTTSRKANFVTDSKKANEVLHLYDVLVKEFE